ncbi:MAG: prenyltransferase/squalene oxidase repeat-containing protein, partial [Syntrophobacteraceae bacterium]
MRRYNTGGLLCLVVFSAALAFYAAERAGAEEAKKIDLSAISKYVDDWTARDTFPDSPSFAYMNVYCRLALGGQVSDATKKRIIDYLTGCQKRDGGFVTNPEDKEETPAGSNLIFTYFALATLDLIGAPSAVDTKKAAEFVLSLVQEDGAIKPTTGSR